MGKLLSNFKVLPRPGPLPAISTSSRALSSFVPPMAPFPSSTKPERALLCPGVHLLLFSPTLVYLQVRGQAHARYTSEGHIYLHQRLYLRPGLCPRHIIILYSLVLIPYWLSCSALQSLICTIYKLLACLVLADSRSPTSSCPSSIAVTPVTVAQHDFTGYLYLFIPCPVLPYHTSHHFLTTTERAVSCSSALVKQVC